MRYFFHLLDTVNLHNLSAGSNDFIGTILSSPKAAKIQAAKIAAELLQDGCKYHGFSVVIIDGRGSEIARVPVGIASKKNTG